MAEAQQILCPNCHKSNPPRAKFCMHCRADVILNNDGPMCFKITSIIKEGGQGAVYQAIAADKNGQPLGQPVYAVKEMLDRFTDPKEEAEAIERFEEEAQLLKRLTHPRIPRIYASFKDEERQYLAMDFVRGKDMEDIIRERGALPEAEVLAWADQLCDVLNYLHNHRPEPIIFRDMKPSNVMIEPDGGVKLIDFGIAKVFQRAQRGTQIGTPGYAPPEQYQGLAAPTSDIYALAATLHHMLTGRDPRDEPPFSFPPVYGLRPTVSHQTSDAIGKALQMKPEDRYQSVAEFRAALRPLPAPQPQVRVAAPTQALPPQPQVAPAPGAARPSAPAANPAPAAAPPTSRVAPATIPAPIAAPARPRRSGGFFGRLLRFALVLLLILGLAAGAAAFAFPEQASALANQYLPGLLSQPTAAPQVFVDQEYKAEIEIEVPADTSAEALRQRFVEAYTSLAQATYGAGTRVNTNVPPTYFGGLPQKTGDGANGAVKYRATLQGRIQVPQ